MVTQTRMGLIPSCMPMVMGTVVDMQEGLGMRYNAELVHGERIIFQEDKV
jgi:hypothetical protein